MMRRSTLSIALIGFVLALAPGVLAQKYELAVLAGGQFPQSSTGLIGYGKSPALQVNFAARIAHVPLVSAYLEIPVVVGFKADVSSGLALTSIPRDYNALFVTPGLKVKIAPGFPISPYFVAGIGVARLRGSDTLQNSSTNPDTTSHSAVFDVGGGVDFKVAPFVSLRGELRDFYSGLPNLNLSGLPDRQHNLLVSAGLVLRF